jgi:hypothetical protein
MTKFEKISVFNFLATLMLSVIAVFLSYNSYRISENTFLLSQKVESINHAQAKNELLSSASALLTAISMLRQTDPEGKDLVKSIQALNEMKVILESQMKNHFLAQKPELSENWVELYSRIIFYIKFLSEGLKPHNAVAGVNDILIELDNKTSAIHSEVLKTSF